jgi:hypothetical protein
VSTLSTLLHFDCRRRAEALEAALRDMISALENVDRHVGLLGGELSKLRAARALLSPPALPDQGTKRHE